LYADLVFGFFLIRTHDPAKNKNEVFIGYIIAKRLKSDLKGVRQRYKGGHLS